MKITCYKLNRGNQPVSTPSPLAAGGCIYFFVLNHPNKPFFWTAWASPASGGGGIIDLGAPRKNPPPATHPVTHRGGNPSAIAWPGVARRVSGGSTGASVAVVSKDSRLGGAASAAARGRGTGICGALSCGYHNRRLHNVIIYMPWVEWTRICLRPPLPAHGGAGREVAGGPKKMGPRQFKTSGSGLIPGGGHAENKSAPTTL